MYLKKSYRHLMSAVIGIAMLGTLIVPLRMAALAAAESTIRDAVAPTDAVSASDTFSGFGDVREDDWFYADVMRLANEKIFNGYPDGNFYPEREITNAEFIKVIVTALGAASELPMEELLFDGHWASGYITLAHAAGIFTDEDIDAGMKPDAPILRSEMIRMMARALEIKASSDDVLPFEDSTDPYASALYREYIYRGYPTTSGTRISQGDSPAKRSEAAAIAGRVMDYRNDEYEYKKKVILDNAEKYPLTHEFELSDLFYVLNREFISDFTMKTPFTYAEWVEIYREANVKYLEYFYASYLNCEYVKNSNTYRLYLDYELDVDTLRKYHTDAEAAADLAVASSVTPDMSDRDKVKALHDYLVLNCSYDYKNYSEGTITYDSRLAYGALCSKSAVCQGYTAAFNMMARRAGITSEIVTGKSPGNDDTHAWNRVWIDGEVYYLDVTHDDPVPDQPGRVSYKYFMLTEDEMIALGYLWKRGKQTTV